MLDKKIPLHSERDFAAMREAGELAAETLDYITPFIEPGVTTGKLDQLCHNFITQHNAIPAPLHYKGFPKSICTSINHVVCHGIPSEKKLKNGDTLNIDVTVKLNGWHGDTSRMFFVGDKVSVKAKRLIQTTYDCMMKGIEQVRPGAKLYNVGKAIQEYAEKYNYSVVRDFCGHGVGEIFHTVPNVLHYYSRRHNDITLEPGMFFTIEPMINVGGYACKILADDWTAVTKDKSLSAQFEHSLGVTENGFEIFTYSPKGRHCPPYNIV